MRYLVYRTEKCERSAASHGVLNEVKGHEERIERDQSISNWDCFLPEPIIRKKLGSFRLIAIEKILGDIKVICFLGVWPRGSADYEKFLVNSKEFVSRLVPPESQIWVGIEGKQKQIKENDNFPLVPPPDEIEYGYLYNTEIDEIDDTYGLIFESHDWVKLIKSERYLGRASRFFDLLTEKVIDSRTDNTIVVNNQSGVKILYKRFPLKNYTFLIAPILNEENNVEEMFRDKYKDILNENENIIIEKLLKFSGRSNPKLVLADDEQTWHEIQKNSEGNLALSPEEASILKQITTPEDIKERFPLFINGRPGSGKSTILQYLFAEHLFLHLCKSENRRVCYPPVYLTYNERLLSEAKKAVNTIMKCNATFVTHQHIKMNDVSTTNIIRQGFGEFHNFILKLLPQDIRKENFRPDKYIQFTDFRREWNKYRKKDPDIKIRKMSPELAWHAIRTFVKGMSDHSDGYFDPDSYEELSREQQTISKDNYRFIYERVWENWYKPLCKNKGYWDNQDLTAAVLETINNKDLAKYPAIFCDEAQDFTRNELELILKFSLFSHRSLKANELTRVPFAFAGDPFQTLNPTGFDWKVVRTGFHEKIVRHLDRNLQGSLSMNYRELSFNYRSSKHIVGFANLIQLLRGLLFDIQDLKPQKAWFGEEYNKYAGENNVIDNNRLPQYFDVENDICRKVLSERSEMIIILPCQEGEEEEYVKNDDLLKGLVNENYFNRNFLSAMQAKGLEFQTVVLYKFGEDLANHYPNFFDPLKNGEPHKGEEALPLEYFINRLYVAASRAKNTLLIMDTKKGIETIWNNYDILNFDVLITTYNSGGNIWNAEDLTLVQPGMKAALGSSVQDDNPQDIADSFRLSGISENDPYLLRLAAANYKRSNNDREAMICEAIAYKYEDNLEKAGLLYISLGEKEEALECLWCSGLLSDIVDNNLFANSIYQKTAAFIQQAKLEKPSFNHCKTIVEEIIKTEKNAPSLFQAPYHIQWTKAINSIIFSFIRSEPPQNATPIVWRSIYNHFQYLTVIGIFDKNNPHFADLAFNAENYDDAVKMWEKGSTKNHRRYCFAKAKVVNFPEKLDWLFKADEIAEAAKIVEVKKVDRLPLEHIDKLVNYHEELGNHDKAVELLNNNPDYNKFREFYYKNKEIMNNSVIKTVLDHLIHLAISNSKWDDVINY